MGGGAPRIPALPSRPGTPALLRQAMHSEECGYDLVAVVPGYRTGRAATSPRGQPSGEMNHVDAKPHPYLSHLGPCWPHSFRIPAWALRPISPEVELKGWGTRQLPLRRRRRLQTLCLHCPVQCWQRLCPAGRLALPLSIPWRSPWARGVFQVPTPTCPL